MALSTDVWKIIRQEYEYGADEPSMQTAAIRMGTKFGFKPPSKSTISEHVNKAKAEGNTWERRGSMAGIVSAAHRKADRMVDSDGQSKPSSEPKTEPKDKTEPEKPELSLLGKEIIKREECEDLRAEVIARHRNEWKLVGMLVQESLQNRKVDIKKSHEQMRYAKLTAETIMIRQNGERKAWGLDEIYIDVSKMTDEQLQDILNGKMPR